MKFTRKDGAVSEVIGAMLMVTVVVVLAGIVAAFIFGMAGNVSDKPKSIKATAQKPDAGTIVVTYSGGPDSKWVETITWTVTPDTGSLPPSVMGTPGSILNVGTSYAFKKTGGFYQRTHVVGAAHFSDSSPDQVILDVMV